MILGTSTGCHKFPFAEEFKILVCAMNRQVKTCDAVEERMQSANKDFWKDILIHKSKGVPWKIECQRLVDHVYAVFAFWECSVSKDIKKKRGSTTILERANWPERYGDRRACPFCLKKAESMWRAMGWVCDEKSNAAIKSLKKVYKWRSTRWWHSYKQE